MAVVKYGTIVTELKGKVGGNIFQGGYTAPIFKKKAAYMGITKRFAAAIFSVFIDPRYNLSLIASNWQNLSAEDQATWSTNAPLFPFKNKFGESYVGSGFQVYMMINLNLAQIGTNFRDASPAPSPGHPPFNPSGTSGDPPELLRVGALPPEEGDWWQIIEACAQQNNGTQPIKGRWKTIKKFHWVNGADVDLKPNYNTLFGKLKKNKTIWLRVRDIEVFTGQSTEWTYGAWTVTQNQL